MEVPRSANAEAEAAFAVVKGGSKPWRRSSRRMIDSDGCSSFTQTGSPVRQSPINDQKSKIRMESTRVLSRDWVGDYGGLERRLKRYQTLDFGFCSLRFPLSDGVSGSGLEVVARYVIRDDSVVSRSPALDGGDVGDGLTGGLEMAVYLEAQDGQAGSIGAASGPRAFGPGAETR